MGLIVGGTFGGVWTSYTPSLTGFSVQPASVVAEWVRLGPKTFAVKLDMSNAGGTSNSTAMTITIPFLAKAQNRHLVMGLNNSIYTALECYTAAGSNILTFYTLAAGVLTNTGGKGAWLAGIIIEEQ